MTEKATEVKDIITENGIKWNNVAQALIIATILGVGGIGISFGDRIIVGMDKLNDSLVDIRKEISMANTQGQVNDSRLNKHEKDISQNTQDIKQLYSRE